MEAIEKNGHIIDDVELEKGGYSHDTLTYTADGEYTQVDGEFFVDGVGMLHHTHIFEDNTEIEILTKY